MDEQIEEAVAEAFRRWKAGLPTDTAVSRLFDRIVKLVQAVRNVLGRRQIATWEDFFRDIERGNRRGEVRTGGTQRAAEARRRRKRGGHKKRRPGPSPAEIERQRAQRLLDDPRPDLSEKSPVPVVDVSELKTPSRRGSQATSDWAENLKGVCLNADTGLRIAIGRDAVGKALSSATTPAGRVLLLALPELLKTAIQIESTHDTKGRGGVFGYHRLLGAVRIGSSIRRMLLHVRHTRDG